MKRLLFSILLATSISAMSQEFDEEFLESLPEDIMEDVVTKGKLKEDLEKPVYRKASTMRDKDSDDDKSKDKKDIDSEDNERSVFGKKFFDTMQSSFMPINEPNFDGSYVLDFGDVLEIQFIGQVDSLESYELKRDGSINVPDIGKILLAGLTLKDASNLVKAKTENTFIGTEAFISLKNVRDIRVVVAGNAYNPGIYTLNGNSNILHAITMAGGIDDFGSYRNIDLIRNNEIIETLDVYDVLLRGSTSFAKSLRSGDSILVNPRKKLVTVESGVLRPGIYELDDDENIEDLIFFANGLDLHSDSEEMFIKRINKGKSIKLNINYEDIDSTLLKNGDSLFIREYKFNTVEIKGAVKNPGIYLLPMGSTLSQLVMEAGGYEDNAYPFGGYYSSEKSLKINVDAKERLYASFLNSVVENTFKASTVSAGSGVDGTSLGILLSQLKEAPVTGRVIAEFDLDVIQASPKLDTILDDGDEIIIPNITQQVYVQGEVGNPGAIRHSKGKGLNYYLNGSGGPMSSADLSTVFVIHPNGESQKLYSSSKLSFISPNNNDVLLYPGSIIYVPKNTNLKGIESAAVWAPIISSLALSITSLSVLSND